MNFAGEGGLLRADAEGATTPETFRQMDRKGMVLWKAGLGHFVT
tara:strand:+ start:2323 stop:2454 length:132 start_codon:yes stop_codon:yes gene_type:complete